MINTKTFTFAALAIFSSLVAADPCEDKAYYCAETLWELGDYDDSINEALEEADQPLDNETRHNSLFQCGESSKLSWVITCNKGCTNSAAFDHYCL